MPKDADGNQGIGNHLNANAFPCLSKSKPGWMLLHFGVSSFQFLSFSFGGFFGEMNTH